jgi:tetratricopeptide (TPR) repeat protein
LHRLDDAKNRYDQALEINPNDANALSLRGMLLGFQDRGLEAAQDTERALHLAPLDPHRFFYLAMAAGAWMSAGNYEKVETYAKASLRLNKTHVSTLRMLVVAQQKQGKLRSVQDTLSELMRLQPSLRVSSWLRSSPSANFINGRSFAQALLDAGVPD